MKIVTNNHARPLIEWYELTDAEKSEFGHAGEDAQFVRYRGQLIHLGVFVRIAPQSKAVGFECGVPDDSQLRAWDGIASDSYFSATVIRLDDDGERAVVGRCFS